MKVMILVLIMCIAGSGCRKTNEIPEDVETETKLMIKGRIPEGKKYQDTLTLADAANVLIFHPGTYSNRTEYRIIAIDDGEFSSELKMSTGIAVVFLNEDYKYIGNLYIEGMNMLPLGNLTNKDQTVIDLLTLSQDGNHIIPSHNPLGAEIFITIPEMEAFTKLGGYFESLAKNIDTDNDESADILLSRHLIVSTAFRMFLGKWGTNDTMAASVETSDLYINQLLTIEGGVDYSVSNDDVRLSGPADSTYQDIKLFQFTVNPNQNASFIAQFIRETPAGPDAPWDSDYLPFKKGIYTLSIGGATSLTFEYSNTEARNSAIIATPTLLTNSDGQFTSIALIYSLPTGLIIYPEDMLANVIVKLYNANGNVYQPQTLTVEKGFYELKLNQPYDLSVLSYVDILYDDLAGNRYYITWKK